MKILNAQQIQQADQHTIFNEPISSIELMERASQTFSRWFVSNFDKKHLVCFFCGPGNNGGDGFASARQLHKQGYNIILYQISNADALSKDAQINKERFESIQNILYPEDHKNIEIPKEAIIIDAIFGAGLDRPIQGIYADCIACLNQKNNIKIAIDSPSGLGTDNNIEGIKFKANFTFSFELPKLNHLLPENEEFVGKWQIKSIGLSPQYIKEAECNYHFVDHYFIQKAIYKPKKLFSHKGNNGHALIIAGSRGMIGAAQLSLHACLKTGAGLTTGYIPNFGYDILQGQLPEIMLYQDQKDYLSNCDIDINQFDSIGIGPGLNQKAETAKALIQVLRYAQKPLVIDADAINLMGQDPVIPRFLPSNSILTPHPGEFKRIAGHWKNDHERLQKQIDYAKKHQCYVVLKGRYTSISSPDGQVYFNSTGNPGMATAGSGDVLTGIITSLLAQGYNSLEASVMGVYIHGLAGDLALEKESFESLTARDIIYHLGQAFKTIANG